MDLFQTFTVQVAEIGRGITRIKNEEMKEFGLKGMHVSCMYYIYMHRENGILLTDLCELCREDNSCVSRSLAALKRMGYVRTEYKRGMSYKYLLKLTEKGEETGARICEKIDGVLAEIRSSLDPEEEKIFYKCLIQITESMERICGRYEIAKASERLEELRKRYEE